MSLSLIIMFSLLSLQAQISTSPLLLLLLVCGFFLFFLFFNSTASKLHHLLLKEEHLESLQRKATVLGVKFKNTSKN